MDVVVTVLLIDSSMGRGDAWAWCFAGWTDDTEGRRRLCVWGMRSLEGKFAKNMKAPEVIAMVVADARHNGAVEAYGDTYQAYLLTSEFEAEGIRYNPLNWTQASKTSAVVALREWINSQVLAFDLEEQEWNKLRREVAAFQEKILAGGQTGFGARRGAHDDRIACLINLAIGVADGLVPDGETAEYIDWGSLPSNIYRPNRDEIPLGGGESGTQRCPSGWAHDAQERRRLASAPSQPTQKKRSVAEEEADAIYETYSAINEAARAPWEKRRIG